MILRIDESQTSCSLCRPEDCNVRGGPVSVNFSIKNGHLALQTNAALALAAPAPSRGATHGAATAGGR